ncbi:MAG: formate dehydrogenase accessory sulfurtransferase FdhD [Myxococcales bacterium]|nr:formate dehydrogenase accessory sulfurtransferase FdhD [Myxococcales bacterium]
MQSARVRVLRHRPEGAHPDDDLVAVEAPLEIRVEGPDGPPAQLAVTMRTPGHDAELAVGFLVTEGIVRSPSDLRGRVRSALPVEGRGDIVTVPLAVAPDPERHRRNFYATSSCGVCGKAALDQVEVLAPRLDDRLSVDVATVRSLPERLRAAQATFDATGGLHATGLFDLSDRAPLVREDVGRHNALDKALGRRFLDDPGRPVVAMVSGRASFELVQKCAVAGVPVLCAVGAPSSLAVALAERLNLTLVGFLRGARFNVYAGPQRITDLGGVTRRGDDL